MNKQYNTTRGVSLFRVPNPSDDHAVHVSQYEQYIPTFAFFSIKENILSHEESRQIFSSNIFQNLDQLKICAYIS